MGWYPALIGRWGAMRTNDGIWWNELRGWSFGRSISEVEHDHFVESVVLDGVGVGEGRPVAAPQAVRFQLVLLFGEGRWRRRWRRPRIILTVRHQHQPLRLHSVWNFQIETEQSQLDSIIKLIIWLCLSDTVYSLSIKLCNQVKWFPFNLVDQVVKWTSNSI